MSLLDFLKLLLQYRKWLLTLPLAVALAVFFLTSRQPQIFKSQMLLHTGIVKSSDGALDNAARIDVYAVNNAFDNLQTIITSRQVMEETGLRLLASHWYQSQTPSEKLEPSIREFLQSRTTVLNTCKGPGVEDIYNQLLEKAGTPDLLWYLEDESSIYSYKSIKKGLQLKRSGSSDILELSFEANEPSICQETLIILSNAFTKRFRDIRKSEVGTMVSFFEQEVEKAGKNLADHGTEMKDFQKTNRIINYYEQTHLTTIETEHLNGQFYEEQMKLAAAEGALRELYIKLGKPFASELAGTKIIHSQELLASLHTQNILNNGSSDSVAFQIKSEEQKLKDELSQLYVDGRTTEGISKKDVLKQWLEQFIAVSEAQARVTVMKQHKQEQEKMYDFYAPLGSQLDNYERQMNVAEREYLDLLHSLNQARLREQSLETSTSLSIVDPPKFPSKAEPSKRKLLIVVGWLGTMVLLLSTILFVEYIDSTLQGPVRAENKTGLEVIGALPPDTGDRVYQVAKTDFIARFLSHFSHLNPSGNKNILVVSRMEQHNCTQQAVMLKDFLLHAGNSVGIHMASDAAYQPGSEQIHIHVMPSLEQAASAWHLFSHVEVVLFVAPSSHTWTNADVKGIELIEKATGKTPFLVITEVEPSRLENWIGEIPKSRSRVRKFIKRMVQFQFH